MYSAHLQRMLGSRAEDGLHAHNVTNDGRPKPSGNSFPKVEEELMRSNPTNEAHKHGSIVIGVCALCRRTVSSGEKQLVMSCCRSPIHGDCYNMRLRAWDFGDPVPACQVCAVNAQLGLLKKKEREPQEERPQGQKQRVERQQREVRSKDQEHIDLISSEK